MLLNIFYNTAYYIPTCEEHMFICIHLFSCVLGRDRLIVLQDERILEKEQIKTDLTLARQILPACCALLESYTAAAQLSIRLNVSFAEVVSSMNAVDVSAALSRSLLGGGTRSDSNSDGSGSAADVVGQEEGEEEDLSTVLASVIETPASKLRQKYQKEGFGTLTQEEQRWVVLDSHLNPTLYDIIHDSTGQHPGHGKGYGLGLGKGLGRIAEGRGGDRTMEDPEFDAYRSVYMSIVVLFSYYMPILISI